MKAGRCHGAHVPFKCASVPELAVRGASKDSRVQRHRQRSGPTAQFETSGLSLAQRELALRNGRLSQTQTDSGSMRVCWPPHPPPASEIRPVCSDPQIGCESWRKLQPRRAAVVLFRSAPCTLGMLPPQGTLADRMQGTLAKHCLRRNVLALLGGASEAKDQQQAAKAGAFGRQKNSAGYSRCDG